MINSFLSFSFFLLRHHSTSIVKDLRRWWRLPVSPFSTLIILDLRTSSLAYPDFESSDSFPVDDRSRPQRLESPPRGASTLGLEIPPTRPVDRRHPILYYSNQDTRNVWPKSTTMSFPDDDGITSSYHTPYGECPNLSIPFFGDPSVVFGFPFFVEGRGRRSELRERSRRMSVSCSPSSTVSSFHQIQGRDRSISSHPNLDSLLENY